MKKLSRILLSATLLASAPALAAEAAPKAAPPPAADPHAGHDHGAEMGPSRDLLNAGHRHAVQETEEERARVAAANGLTEAKLKALALFEREQLKGASFREALKKAKLKAKEADALSFLTDNYYRARLAARKAQEELEGLRAQAEASKDAAVSEVRSRAQLLERQLQEHERWRGQFLKKCSEQARTLIDKAEDEFVGLLEEADEAAEKREAEAKLAAAKGFTEEKLSQFLGMLQATAKGAPHAVALKKSGLDGKEADGLSLLLTEYYNKKLIAQEDQKRLDETRARLTAARANKKDAPFDERLERFYQDKLEAFEKFRTEFVGKWGQKLTDALDKRASEFIEAYKKRHEAIAPKEQ